MILQRRSCMESISPSFRKQQIIAFIIACLLYLCIIALLLLEFHPLLEYNNFQSFEKQIPLIPLSARKNSAPVRLMTPSQPQQSSIAPPKTAPPLTPPPMPSQATVSQPQLQPIHTQTASHSLPSETEKINNHQSPKPSEKPLPKVLERHIHASKKLTEDAVEPKKIEQMPQEQQELEDDENVSCGRKQRSKNKWYKDGTMPEPQAHDYHPSPLAALADGFHEHMRKNYDKQLPMGIRGAENGSADPKAIEFGMFMYRFDHQLCQESRMRPLPLHDRLIKAHIIEVIVTVSRARKVMNVTFPKPSYNEQLNDYVRDLLYAMTTPQLPASYPENETILPLRIRIDRIYNQDKIWLIPME